MIKNPDSYFSITEEMTTEGIFLREGRTKARNDDHIIPRVSCSSNLTVRHSCMA